MTSLVLGTLQREANAAGLSDAEWCTVVLDYQKDLPRSNRLRDQDDRTIVPSLTMLQGLRDARE